MQVAIWVGIGGILGAWARLYMGMAIALRTAPSFPWGTFAINILGCFVLGVINTLVFERGLSDVWRLGVGVGFCGAFTTFSTFGFETMDMLRQGRYGAALLYVAASNALGLVAVAMGVLLARQGS